MAEKYTEWPSDEELAFVNAGGDILDISDPPPEVIQRVTEKLQKEWGLKAETTDWLTHCALHGTSKPIPLSIKEDIQHLFG